MEVDYTGRRDGGELDKLYAEEIRPGVERPVFVEEAREVDELRDGCRDDPVV